MAIFITIIVIITKYLFLNVWIYYVVNVLSQNCVAIINTCTTFHFFSVGLVLVELWILF